MPQASVLRALATSRPDEARDIIRKALKASNGDRTKAAHALRASNHLPPDGTDERTRVTFLEIVKALKMTDEVRDTYAEKDAKRAVERAKRTTKARVEANANPTKPTPKKKA